MNRGRGERGGGGGGGGGSSILGAGIESEVKQVVRCLLHVLLCRHDGFLEYSLPRPHDAQRVLFNIGRLRSL